MNPTVGRIVHYRLSENDLKLIDFHRTGTGLPANTGELGQVIPLIIVRVWPDEYGPGVPGVNGQAFLDGSDTLWVTSAREGEAPGQWFWPPRE